MRNATTPTLGAFLGSNTIFVSLVSMYQCLGDTFLIHVPQMIPVTVPITHSNPSMERTILSIPFSMVDRFDGAALLFIIILESCPV